MDQEVDVARQFEYCLVVLADALGSRAERRRTVVGDVRDGRVAVAHPETHRAPTLVRHVQRNDAEPLGLEACRRGTEAEASSRRAAGAARSGRTAATSSGRAASRRRCSSSAGRTSVTRASVAVPGSRRRAVPGRGPSAGASGGWCHERGWPPRSAERRRRPVPASSSSVGGTVEPRIAVVRQRHAGRVPPVADEFGTRGGRRPPESRRSGRARSVSRLVLAAMPRGQLLEVRAIDEVGLEEGHPARGHGDVARRADAAFEVRALTEQGARTVLGEAFTAALDPDDPVEDEEDLGARLPLLEEDRCRPGTVRCGVCRRPASAAPTATVSSADSTAETSASESSSPQGLCLPNDLRYQSLKSVSPDLCESGCRCRTPSAVGTGWPRRAPAPSGRRRAA